MRHRVSRAPTFDRETHLQTAVTIVGRLPGDSMLNVLLPTLGSAGDVHPIIALGIALIARGHRATVMTSELFRPLIEKHGLAFLAVGSLERAQATIANPDLWHRRRGFKVVAQHIIVPSIAEIYTLIERHADADTVVAASTLCFGARVAQEKLLIPTATLHMQPSVIRSRIDQGMFGDVRIAASQPMWFKNLVFQIADRWAIDRWLKGPLNEFRSSLGLPEISRVLDRWLHSPQLVIGFFPPWFATPQVDWPPNSHAVGFPLWDGGAAEAPMMADAEEFLNAGEPPVVFTPGSAGSTLHRYFAESINAIRRLGIRAMLVTNFPAQVPRDLPGGVKVFTNLPFSAIFPRAALMVYHGGIGTLAQGIQAGIPQLVVPNGHDQFDSAWRIEQLRLGLSLPQTRYRAVRAAAAIRTLLDDRTFSERARQYAARIDSAASLKRACQLIEGLAPLRGI